MQGELLSVEQVGSFLDCTPEHVQSLLRDGTLPGIRLGKSWCVPTRSLTDRLNELAVAESASRRHRLQPPPPPPPPVAVSRGGRPRLR